MDGITGLQLLGTVVKGASGGIGIFSCVMLAILGMIIALCGIYMLCEEDSVGCVVLIGGICLLYFAIFTDHNPTEGYKEYKCAIADENYHIDLDKYEIVTIEGKLITLKDKIN